MEESILKTIRTLLVGDADDITFDLDLIVCINTAFNNLTDVGVGPKEGFEITGLKEKWSDFTGNAAIFNRVKTYIQLETRLIFDPPSSAYVLESMQKKADEALWRLNNTVDDQSGKEEQYGTDGDADNNTG